MRRESRRTVRGRVYTEQYVTHIFQLHNYYSSYRVTVIRNLPQLQKLDNLPVQSDEMADAMRRGIELVHPLEREPGPQPMSPPSNSYQSHYRPPQVG